MSTIDIIILIPLLFGAYQGYKKGFLIEVIAIIAFVPAIIGAFKLLQLGMDFLNKYFNLSGEIVPYLAFIIIFVGIVLLANLLGKLLKKLIDLTLLGAVDNFAGAVLSLLKWAFGLSVLFWLSSSTGLEVPAKWSKNSILYPYIVPFAPEVVEYVSVVMPFAHELFDSIKEFLRGGPAS